MLWAENGSKADWFRRCECIVNAGSGLLVSYVVSAAAARVTNNSSELCKREVEWCLLCGSVQCCLQTECVIVVEVCIVVECVWKMEGIRTRHGGEGEGDINARRTPKRDYGVSLAVVLTMDATQPPAGAWMERRSDFSALPVPGRSEHPPVICAAPMPPPLLPCRSPRTLLSSVSCLGLLLLPVSLALLSRATVRPSVGHPITWPTRHVVTCGSLDSRARPQDIGGHGTHSR